MFFLVFPIVFLLFFLCVCNNPFLLPFVLYIHCKLSQCVTWLPLVFFFLFFSVFIRFKKFSYALDCVPRDKNSCAGFHRKVFPQEEGNGERNVCNFGWGLTLGDPSRGKDSAESVTPQVPTCPGVRGLPVHGPARVTQDRAKRGDRCSRLCEPALLFRSPGMKEGFQGHPGN